MHSARIAKLADAEQFIRKLEQGRHNSRISQEPISVLIADGEALGSRMISLRNVDDVQERVARSRELINPYLQIVDGDARCQHTGIPLPDIWRYFRYTWRTPYELVPGRNIRYLVRDAALDYHPVMGIGSLVNAPISVTARDDMIGWHPGKILVLLLDKTVERREKQRHVKRLVGFLDDALEEIDAKGLCEPKDLEVPSEHVIQRLRIIAVEAAEKHKAIQNEYHATVEDGVGGATGHLTGRDDDGKLLGIMPGNPPKGFKREPVVLGRKRNGEERVASRWVKDPETWDRCKLAWKMRATGSSYREVHSVTRLLGSLNSYPTFFSNEIYRGTQKFGETRNENCYPACCTPEQWDAVAKLRKDAREKRDSGTAAPRRGNYLLTGSLRCAYCGKPMVGSRSSSGAGKPYRYYICQTKHRAAKACPSKRLSANMVEGTVIDHMFENVLSLEGLRWLVEQYRARRTKSNALEERIESLKRELATHEAAIERLMDLAEAGGGQLLALSKRMSEHEADTLQIKGDLARLESEARSQLDYDLDDASLRKLAKKWRQELRKGDPDKAKQVIKLFVREIKASKHKGLAKYTSPLWKITYKQCAPTGRQPLYATPAVTIVWDKARKGQPVFP